VVSQFGFEVHRDDAYDDEPERWRVQLPHQCDAWSIAGDGYDGEPYDKAIASLETFIAEAQQAMVALRQKKEHGRD
jgi:hypothetical protein